MIYAIYFILYFILEPNTDLIANLVGIFVPSAGAILSDTKIFMGFSHVITLIKSSRKKANK